MAETESFYETLTAAVKFFSDHGYTNAEDLTYWQARLGRAIQRSLKTPAEMERMLQQAMYTIYSKMVERGGWSKYHPGVAPWTIERVKPSLRAELDRRIMASAELIRLNRARAIEQTLQRFASWATSIPLGGSEAVDKPDTKGGIRKALASLPFEERRVLIDQGHKLIASINSIIAEGNNAIAAVWRSHWRQAGYNYREDHKERDMKVYLVRGNWAAEKGLAKVGPDGYLDEITQPGEEVFCRCWTTHIYNLASLPKEMLTKKGRDALEGARAEIARQRVA